MLPDMWLAWLADRPVSAKRLHRCSIPSGGGKAWRASVFPFFEATGVVRAVLCVRHDEPGLFVAPYREGLLTCGPPWLPRRVDLCLGELATLTDTERVRELARLWHYDPWWVLAKPPFDEHFATATLKPTNCVDLLPRSPKSLLFEAGLRRVRAVMVAEGDQVVSLPWQRGWLPGTPGDTPLATTQSARRRWVLDPIWARNRT